MTDRLKTLCKRFGKRIHIRKTLFPCARFIEAVVFGGRIREAILVRLLGAFYRSSFRRDWVLYSDVPPHFSNSRANAFAFIYGSSRSPYPLFRGFLACEVIQNGDRLLDIGCGDGFFSAAFFAENCQRIDAVDVEMSAIDAARRLNPHPKVVFHRLDAVRDAFPSASYDVIVWDGAIGHFPPADLNSVLEKIVRALSPSGVFVGSESLGHEGSDHLQFFENESALAAVLRPYFKHVLTRITEYRIQGGYMRREVYWRCSNDENSRHRQTGWIELGM